MVLPVRQDGASPLPRGRGYAHDLTEGIGEETETDAGYIGCRLYHLAARLLRGLKGRRYVLDTDKERDQWAPALDGADATGDGALGTGFDIAVARHAAVGNVHPNNLP